MTRPTVDTPSDVEPALYRVKDAAARAAVSEFEIRRLSAAGVLERRYIGESRRSYRITAESLDRWINDLPAEPGGY